MLTKIEKTTENMIFFMNYVDTFTLPPKTVTTIDSEVLVNIFINNVSEVV